MAGISRPTYYITGQNPHVTQILLQGFEEMLRAHRCRALAARQKRGAPEQLRTTKIAPTRHLRVAGPAKPAPSRPPTPAPAMTQPQPLRDRHQSRSHGSDVLYGTDRSNTCSQHDVARLGLRHRRASVSFTYGWSEPAPTTTEAASLLG